MIRTASFVALFLGALSVFGFRLRNVIRKLALGKAENRFGQMASRLANVAVIVFGQSRLLRERLAGLLHFFLFWGFVILLSAVLEALAQGFAPGFSLPLGPLAALQEFMGLAVAFACTAALLRWHLLTPRRYYGREISGHVRLDASIILGLILVIMISMFGVNGCRMALSPYPDPARFVSMRLMRLFTPAQARAAYPVFWWVHLCVILGFLDYLPHSKHFHVLSSIPNVFFSSLQPPGRLQALDFADESAEKFGAQDIEDLTWKQLLDGFTCTDCGRCTAACPASITGKLLSPRKIIMNIRERASVHPEAGSLLEGRITDEELWDCTTCRACMQECPVMIEHVPAIMDMRRYLVLTESRFPAELTAAYKSLETNYNPWGFGAETRQDWARGLGVPTMSETGGRVDLLYWVGCAGSYDARYQKVARSVVKLMRAAGVRFAILGNEEKCNGDPARRSGNEYLAQMLMSENIRTLNRYGVRRIVASCPHCFNTLKNEYPQFGGVYEVLHHTEWFAQMIRSGRLRTGVPSPAGRRIVFHDSCYMGRYNAVYEEPRALVARTAAGRLEMDRARSRGLCCGAGGGRMFMEERAGRRINVERTEEALRLGPEVIATECPFCMMMLTDGVKAAGAEERVAVLDVAEILADSVTGA